MFVALFFALVASASPAPTSDTTVFFDFRRPAGMAETKVTGYINSYSVEDEKHSTMPSATILFVPAATGISEVIVVSYPVSINGRAYQCPNNSSSEYAKRFGVCSSLPSSVVGSNHPVTLRVYHPDLPPGQSVFEVTDTITSAKPGYH